MTREPHFIPTAYDFHGHKISGCFGDALLEVLRFTPAEIETDIANSERAGITVPPATPDSIATAVAAKGKQDTAVRLHTKRRHMRERPHPRAASRN